MPTKPTAKPKQLSADDLLVERGDVKGEKIINVPLGEIDSFPDHPFQVRIDDEMQELAESIREYGVLAPAIVRQKKDGRYELVSGHRRKAASEIAGKETLPAIVREMDRDTAIVVMTDSNTQREHVLPSEKAKALRMKLEAMKRQAGRPAKNPVPVEQDKSSDVSRNILAEQSGESPSQVQRYIRLTELIPEILQMVDESKMAFRPAVEISYLAEKEQHDLLDKMNLEQATPSLAQAIKLKQLSKDGKLSSKTMLAVLHQQKANQVEKIKIPRDKLSRYFNANTSPAKIEETILEALELLQRKRERSKDRER